MSVDLDKTHHVFLEFIWGYGTEHVRAIFFLFTVILRGRARFELIYVTNEALTVLVNFQAILLILSDETSLNRNIFFTEDAAKKIGRAHVWTPVTL